MLLTYLQSVPFIENALVLGGRPVQADPGFIVGPIAALFGFILNLLFNLVYAISANNSLGFAIILLTVVAMTLMLPLGVKSQKSMTKMQQLGPEVEKIKAKYGKTKDPEITKKINAETQALYAKHKVNPLGGCLPMLIQMPLFFGLLYIMQQSFLYIGTLNDIYISLAEYIQAVPGYLEFVRPLALPYIPNAWQTTGDRIAAYVAAGWDYAAAVEHVGGNYINIADSAHLARVLNRFNVSDWQSLFSYIPNNYLPDIQALYSHKNSIEIFFGLSLLENSGMAWPGVIIPVLTVLTTVGSSWLTQLVNKPKDDKAKTQQTLMLIIMPLFMGFITITMPAGVGLYWIFSNLFRLVQQVVLNAKQGVKFRLPFARTSDLA